MIESHLVEGRQDLVAGQTAPIRPEHHGRVSVASTTTEPLLEQLARAQQARERR